MAGLNKVKKQLKSVKSTKKLTNAMALVATSKLQKQKGALDRNEIFAEEFRKVLLTILSERSFEIKDSIYFKNVDVSNPLHIIITSNSGLCGSYNIDLLKYVKKTIGRDDPIFSIGTYGTKWLMDNNYMVVKKFDDLDVLKPSVINRLIDNILRLYREGEINSIDIIYTQYVNTLTYVPSIYRLLPLEIPDEYEKRDVIFEPDSQTVLEKFIPMYVSSIVYTTFLESKTSENASRRSAMDSANKNAEELIDTLMLNYNQQRQAAITQEVTEITAGANSL